MSDDKKGGETLSEILRPAFSIRSVLAALVNRRAVPVPGDLEQVESDLDRLVSDTEALHERARRGAALAAEPDIACRIVKNDRGGFSLSIPAMEIGNYATAADAHTVAAMNFWRVE